MRTFDESGFQFILLFRTIEDQQYFTWILNEEEIVPDVLDPASEAPDKDLLIGRRSGFAFWIDKAHGNRKVLLAIRRINQTRNDYFDGPFDQLADNYVEQTHVSEYMVKAAPALRGRIDKYGYYTDRERPMRVALSSYYTYLSKSDLLQFLDRAKAEKDPYLFISRRGIPLPTTQPAGGGATQPAWWTRRGTGMPPGAWPGRGTATQPAGPTGWPAWRPRGGPASRPAYQVPARRPVRPARPPTPQQKANP